MRELEEYFSEKHKDLCQKICCNEITEEEAYCEEIALLKIEEELEFLYSMEQGA
jgi:hypothetical protein